MHDCVVLENIDCQKSPAVLAVCGCAKCQCIAGTMYIHFSSSFLILLAC